MFTKRYGISTYVEFTFVVRSVRDGGVSITVTTVTAVFTTHCTTCSILNASDKYQRSILSVTLNLMMINGSKTSLHLIDIHHKQYNAAFTDISNANQLQMYSTLIRLRGPYTLYRNVLFLYFIILKYTGWENYSLLYFRLVSD